MTEAEWLACNDPTPMLASLRGKLSDRKTRLFACACCRRVRRKSLGPMSRRLLELNEKVAEGLARKEDLEVMRSGWLRRLDAAGHPPWRMALVHATETNYQVFPHSARGTAYHAAAAVESTTAEQACQCALLRCIVGPRQFRDVVLTPAWRTATVMSVAQAIYDDRAFDRLPILADALEDAGCTDHAILDHCRQPGEHVRGCWVVDLVLGKE